MRYLVFIIALFAALQTNAQNNIVYGAGINYTNGAPTFTPPVRTSRVAIDTVTGKWYHFNTPGGWQLIGNTIEEIAGCTAPAYTPGKGDSKVVINNCSPQPELYFYNGSAWVLVGGGSVYAGEGIRIENDTIILDSLYVLRFRTGDTTDLNAGAVSWNAGEQTLDVVINQGAVTGQMFQEVLYFTKNQTGAQIDDGTVVMAAGTTGNSGKILIAPAIADGSVNSEYILGLATQNLPNGGEGMVTHFGKVRGIQTNGANYGETWVDGDVLYCSAVTPGYLTKVLPTAPNLKIPIAIVIHAHPSNGTLFVRPSHFPDLAQINDVQLSSPTNGQVLTYNSTLSRWENVTPANQLQTLSTDNTPGNISISSGNTITLNVNDADASATNELQTLSTGTNTLTLSNGGGTVTVDTDPASDVTGSGTSGQVSYWSGTQTQTGSSSLTYNDAQKLLTLTNSTQSGTPRGWIMQQTTGDGASNDFIMQKSRAGVITSGTDVGRWDAEGFDGTAYRKASRIAFTATGTIGSGIVPGTISFLTSNNSGTLTTRTTVNHLGELNHFGSVGIGSLGSPAASLHVRSSGTSSSTWTAQFHNSAGNNNALMIRDDGNVGIGTNAPTGTLSIQGLGTGATNVLTISNSTPTTVFTILNNGRIQQTVVGAATSTLFGTGAGASTTGTGSTFFGALAGNANTTGAANSFFGEYAGILNTTGGENNGIGRGALWNNTTGSRNTAFGNSAGRFLNDGVTPLTTTTNSTFIGNDTRANGNGQTNQIAIGYQSLGLGSNTTRLGNANTVQTHLDGSLTIGDTTLDPSAVLDVSSTTRGVLFPRMTTTERNAIATPADGLVIYNTTDNKLQVRAAGAWVDLH